MDEVLGAKILEVRCSESDIEEGEILSPKSSLNALRKQSAEKSEFNEWLNVLNSGVKQHHSVNDKSNLDNRVSWAKEIEGNNRSIATEIEKECNKEVTNNNGIALKIPETDFEDVSDEIEYWRFVVVCYILGASPPQHVMEGFLKRIWGRQGIDRIVVMGNGIYMVRCDNQEVQGRILEEECHFFHDKPLVVQSWKPDIDWSKKNIDKVPIWVELHGLDVKYWGARSLRKIVGVIGTFMKLEDSQRNNLLYAKVLVEVCIDQDFPDVILFRNEHGQIVEQKVYYAWKPIKCTSCNGYGHKYEQCHKPKKVQQVRKTWVVKQSNNDPVRQSVRSQEGKKEQHGGIQVMDAQLNISQAQKQVVDTRKTNGEEITSTEINNSFALLSEATTDELFYEVETNVIEEMQGGLNRRDKQLEVKHFISRQNVALFGLLETKVQGFRDCVQFCGVNDIKQAGRFFTWNNKQEGFQRVFSKIDRVMANNEWLEAFENGLVTYLPEGEYDHCPGVLCIHKESSGKKPFRFFNMWVYRDGFMELVKDVWQRPMNGCKMFQVTQKLKIMKAELKKFNREGFSDIQAQAHHAYNQMIMKQNIAHEQLREVASIEEERKATEDYKRAQARYLSFLKQKAKERWIEKGDDNTKLFHQSIKARRQQNKIYAILDNGGQWLNEEHQIKEDFVSFYDGLLGTKMGERCTIHQQIIRRGHVLSDEQQSLL
ncbi:uncharacterized protein LOC125498736 [Beta vulgaris subsp. vulgaris]|uniref:uncharacterized protein LOC125498736 n=1 Tax=Beta vulgaris subsp. vulgaris TaxID=3555 RepID=UPI002036F004|nr:uncharacterized protein LOC125498736 [Beta vulgaris subsp. vulgaris]